MEGSDQAFDPETVLQQYRILSSGKTREERTKANQYILKFIQSENAWLVAEKLLLPDQAPETQFIGAQALYQKLQNDYDNFKKDDQIKQLRDNLFQMLQGINLSKSRVVVERLCMSIAFIALKSTNTFWEDSIQNIIAFGSVDQKQCYLALLIIKHIAMIFDQHIFEKRLQTIIKTYLRNNLPQVLEYLNQILTNPQQVAEECYALAFSTAKYWCEYSTTTFIPHEGFISTLFSILNSGPLQAIKVFKIIRQLLIKSKHVKLLENTNTIEAAFEEIPQKDQHFLQLIVQYLTTNRESFNKAANSSIDDDDAQNYASKYANLLITLCCNYELLLIKESETSTMLFQLILECGSAKNLKISQVSLEFWDEFKETITNCLQDLPERQTLFQPYIEIFKILLVQCKRLPNSHEHVHSHEDLEDLEQQEKGMSIGKYRDYAYDVFFKAFYLIKKVFKDEGQQFIFKIIVDSIEGQQDPYTFESSIFATKCILDAMDTSPACIDFLKKVFEVLTSSQLVVQNYFLARGAASFIHEGAQYLQAFPQLLKATLELLLYSAFSHPTLSDIVYKSVFEVCQQCKHKFTDAEFQILYHHLESNYKQMKQEHVGMLMESVCTVCAELPSDKLGLAIQSTLSIATTYFKNMNLANIESINKHDLTKSLLMLSGCIKALDNVDQEILFQALLPMIQQVWPIACRLLEVLYHDYEIILYVCNLLQRLMQSLKTKLKDLFPQLTQSVIVCFQHDPNNDKPLKLLTLACSIFGKESDVLPLVAQSYDQVCQIVMSKVYKDTQVSLDFLNTDIVKCLSELMHKIAEIDINILKNSKHFHDIIILFHETLVNVNEKETNNSLVLFFSYLIASRFAQDIVFKYIDYITVALICSIPKEQGQLLQKLAEAFVILLNNAEAQNYDTQLRNIMAMAMHKPCFADLSENMKQLFIQIMFALKGQRQFIRLALVNFNGLVNHVLAEDSFIGLELEAQKAIKIKEAQLKNMGEGSGPTVISLD